MALIILPFNHRCLIRYDLLNRLAVPFIEEVSTRKHAQQFAAVFLDLFPSSIVVHRLAEDPDTVPTSRYVRLFKTISVIVVVLPENDAALNHSWRGTR